MQQANPQWQSTPAPPLPPQAHRTQNANEHQNMPRVAAAPAVAALLVVLALASAAPRAAMAAAWEKPWFCHELECPQFELVENLTSIGVELRRYAPSTWVETEVVNATSTAPVPGTPTLTNSAGGGSPAMMMPSSASASDTNAGTGYERAVAVGFYKLFRYISGENLTGQKIDMTAPVRVTVSPGVGPTCGDTFKIAFFIAPSIKNPPPPSDSTVKIVTTPESTYYVNSFGGWATGAAYVDRARSVASALEGAGRKIDDACFVTAGYDSPFRLRNRHNEVWLPAVLDQSGGKKVAAATVKPAAVAAAAKPAVVAAAKPSAALKLPTAKN